MGKERQKMAKMRHNKEDIKGRIRRDKKYFKPLFKNKFFLLKI